MLFMSNLFLFNMIFHHFFFFFFFLFFFCFSFFFFFQAEDGIRDLYVTGVQTCALPISPFPRWPRRLQACRTRAVPAFPTPQRRASPTPPRRASAAPPSARPSRPHYRRPDRKSVV